MVRGQRRVRRHDQVGRNLAGGIRPAVEDGFRLMRQECAISADRRPELDDGWMPRVGCLQLIQIRHHRFDRPTSRFGQEIADELVYRQALAAEVTANELRVDDDLRLGHVQRCGELLTQRRR